MIARPPRTRTPRMDRAPETVVGTLHHLWTRVLFPAAPAAAPGRPTALYLVLLLVVPGVLLYPCLCVALFEPDGRRPVRGLEGGGRRSCRHGLVVRLPGGLRVGRADQGAGHRPARVPAAGAVRLADRRGPRRGVPRRRADPERPVVRGAGRP